MVVTPSSAPLNEGNFREQARTKPRDLLPICFKDQPVFLICWQRLIKPGMGFKSFNTARKTIKGYEAMHLLRKGQVIGVSNGDVQAQLNFMAKLLKVAA